MPSPRPVPKTIEPTDQHIRDFYTTHRLPTLRATNPPKVGPAGRPEESAKVCCHLGPQYRKAETTFACLPQRSSIDEAHLSEEEVRERLAAGLWSIFEMDDI
jgi:hypothetical protein